MEIRRGTGIVLLVFLILGMLTSPTPSWGQADERIGTVLTVDGSVEAQAANTTTWEPLQFRAAIFQNDTVRTGADSKVKVLLRDDSIMTLAERSEMQFTEFLLNPQQNQRRTVVSLTLGTLRVITTKIFGAGSVTEVRTANTVAGVRGTGFIVIFIPPDTTQVLTLDGIVSVRNVNPAIPQLEPVPQNFRTQVRGNTAPAAATVLSPAERQSVEQGLRLTEQVPTEVKTTSERQAAAASPIRGETPTTAAAAASVSATPSGVTAAIPVAPLGTQPGQVAEVTPALLTASLPATAVTPAAETILNTVRTLTTVTSTAPPNTSAPITSDSSPTANTVIQQRQTSLRLTIRIPR